MLTQEQDQQLVERVQRGDKRAFDLLVMKYQHKILGLIVRFVHDSHEAQDVAQEAFIKGRRQKLSATPDLSGTVLPLCLIPNSALKSAPPFKSVVPKASACAGLPA
ncbi:hypothetical protein A3710_24880 [Stutzerimonas frequens]|nr:hypothetical protein A3710_24880 [Stutzerimonas frequens]